MTVFFPNIRADFQAHGRSIGAQGFWALVVYRFGRWRYRIRWRWLRMPFSFLYHVLFKWVQVVAGIELPCEAEIGPGLVIDHFGGVIVSGYAKLGRDCRLRNDVVIGLRNVEQPVAPILGDRVDIGAGAKILGAIRIGNDVLIGANAVVLCDVPDGCIAVGVPATVRPRREKKP